MTLDIETKIKQPRNINQKINSSLFVFYIMFYSASLVEIKMKDVESSFCTSSGSNSLGEPNSSVQQVGVSVLSRLQGGQTVCLALLDKCFMVGPWLGHFLGKRYGYLISLYVLYYFLRVCFGCFGGQAMSKWQSFRAQLSVEDNIQSVKSYQICHNKSNKTKPNQINCFSTRMHTSMQLPRCYPIAPPFRIASPHHFMLRCTQV